jgi:neutral ceramidase
MRISASRRRAPRPASRAAVAASLPSLLPVLLALLLGACAANRFTAPDAAPSAAPQPTGMLRAGFGRADFTPPPGPGLMGYGPEGQRSRGWRHRLHARALVIEDGAGERAAIVTVDLGQLSPLLHREVAARVRPATGIGADRLVIAATHTHAGPGHHFGHPSYDEFGTSVSGFDPGMVAFLADRIARAVIEADTSRAEARAAWGTRAIWELTANRSTAPFERNAREWRDRFPKPLGSTASGHVDSTLAVLRIDVRDAASGTFRPAGAFTIFAIHGTGNPSANELIDGDIHAIAARAVELHIDSLNAREPAFRPRAVHLLANGAEGDVSPDMPASTRCQVPTLHRVRRPSGPRTPPGPEVWITPDADSQAACLRIGRGEVEFLGTALGEAIVAVYDSLGQHLTRDFAVRRVFETARIVGSGGGIALCTPQPGTATLGGADDGRTRYAGWRLLGMIDVGFHEDSAHSTRPRETGCQGVKRPFLGRLQRRMTVRLLPEVAQVTLLGLGDVLLVTLPFEATTVAGGRIRNAALGRAPHYRQAVVVGLANGYNQYLATAEEYALQHYEGASTLYGPRTADYFVAWTESLAARMPAGGAPSPPADVPPIGFVSFGESRRLPRADAGPPPTVVDPRPLDAAWRGDTLIISWTDVHPGRLVPADGAVLEIRYVDGAGRSVVTWDDDRDLEVWAMRSLGRRGYHWEARWSPPERPAGDVEIVLLERPALGRRTVQVPDR